MFLTRSLPIVLMYMTEDPSGHFTPRSEKNSFQSFSWLSSPSSLPRRLELPKPCDFISLRSLDAESMRSMKEESTG